MTEAEMVRAILAEMRAVELMTALRHAVGGASHWRWEAQRLLAEIDDGVLRPSCREALREVDARKRTSEIMDDLADAR
ncbi:MAG TPA: hypothetical protein VJO13_06240 [Ktedonobacterales bacterium]|nr:hypothetical protein [Ktedonobacterales bacterium]